MSTQSVETQPESQQSHAIRSRLLIFGGMVAVALLMILLLSRNSGDDVAFVTGGSSVLVLALPAFFAGLLSFLSPCTLPILPAYFAFTFQANRSSIVTMTVAFFLGLATTMTLLGAAFGATSTALSSILSENRTALTFWGGLIVIGFGIMSLFGKGFAGPQISDRPVATTAGSYLYGATFALGWTACIGPILGALFTLLAAQGIAVVQGAVLAFIYALGLGSPLIILATFFRSLGSGSRFWKIMRGKGFELQVGPWNLYLHTTSIASGVLLIAMGALLASGQLESITTFAQANPLTQQWLTIEYEISRLFGLN